MRRARKSKTKAFETAPTTLGTKSEAAGILKTVSPPPQPVDGVYKPYTPSGPAAFVPKDPASDVLGPRQFQLRQQDADAEKIASRLFLHLLLLHAQISSTCFSYIARR